MRRRLIFNEAKREANLKRHTRREVKLWSRLRRSRASESDLRVHSLAERRGRNPPLAHRKPDSKGGCVNSKHHESSVRLSTALAVDHLADPTDPTVDLGAVGVPAPENLQQLIFGVRESAHIMR
jgi:hypothetical protein